MKKLILTAIMAIVTLTVIAQPPLKKIGMFVNGRTVESTWEKSDYHYLLTKKYLKIFNYNSTKTYYRTTPMEFDNEEGLRVTKFEFRTENNEVGIILIYYDTVKHNLLIHIQYLNRKYIEYIYHLGDKK